MRKRLLALFSVLIVGALVLSACGGETVVETVIVEKEGETIIETVVVEKEAEAGEIPVTLNLNLGTEPPTLDPSLATDTTSVDIQENLFIGLTNFNPVTNEVEPYLATSWDIAENADGEQTWTFHLRDDVPWVKYDPISGETTQEVDADGNPRFVNAYDVEYGVKRTVDPATGSDYAYVTYVIKNAAAINGGDEELTIDDLGVKALDETTVEFTLEYPAGYFDGISTMWIVKPMPAWAIDEWGDKWTEAGLIVTSGPYVLESWIHGGELSLVKNPLWIAADSVQIERVDFVMITEASTSFALYENNELDSTGVPLPEMDRVKADPVLSEELRIAPVPCTYYYGFTNSKPPLDDVRVRRAFSQAIDRQSLADNVLKGGQIPATSFAPPGIFGAPEPGTVGLGYDAAAAKASLQEYLDEKGMTIDEFNALDVVLMHNTSEGHARIAAAIQQMWADVLGVTVRVENQEWAVYLDTLKNTTPLEDMPHIWRLGWCADYPDENNWVHEVFNADAGANRLRREAGEFDALTAAAGIEPDPAKRAEMYAEAERLLTEVETAYAPIYHYTSVNVSKPWLTRNFPAIGGIDIYNWTVDMDAKLAAQ
ncbi:MAG TPA: peptide ABC transporter substrate-binding protein [Chloroflexi bacterium]|nr:peptide ABC transporter substrate-binding protein [Chloroflexota bacterium]